MGLREGFRAGMKNIGEFVNPRPGKIEAGEIEKSAPALRAVEIYREMLDGIDAIDTRTRRLEQFLGPLDPLVRFFDEKLEAYIKSPIIKIGAADEQAWRELVTLQVAQEEGAETGEPLYLSAADKRAAEGGTWLQRVLMDPADKQKSRRRKKMVAKVGLDYVEKSLLNYDVHRITDTKNLADIAAMAAAILKSETDRPGVTPAARSRQSLLAEKTLQALRKYAVHPSAEGLDNARVVYGELEKLHDLPTAIERTRERVAEVRFDLQDRIARVREKAKGLSALFDTLPRERRPDWAAVEAAFGAVTQAYAAADVAYQEVERQTGEVIGKLEQGVLAKGVKGQSDTETLAGLVATIENENFAKLYLGSFNAAMKEFNAATDALEKLLNLKPAAELTVKPESKVLPAHEDEKEKEAAEKEYCDPPWEKWKRYENGELVKVLNAEKEDRWSMVPEGVAVKVGDVWVLPNGEEWVGELDSNIYPQGIKKSKNNDTKWWLNGERLPTEDGKLSISGQGDFLIRKEKQLFFMKEGGRKEREVFVSKTNNLRYHFLTNDKWVVKDGLEVFLNDDREKAIYKFEEEPAVTYSHPLGLSYLLKDTIYIWDYRTNKSTAVYSGSSAEFVPYPPDGVMVQTGNNLVYHGLGEEEKKSWPRRGRESGAGEFAYNEQEAKRLDLEPLRLEAYPEADVLIARLLLKSSTELDFIDISKPAGQEQFCRLWKEKNGDLPLPCTPPETLFKELYPGKVFPESINKTNGDFWYLNQLAGGKIVKNLEGEAQPLTPHFGQSDVILVEKWAEENWDAATGDVLNLQSAEYSSKLLSALGISERGIVNIKRGTVDKALWQGDPRNRLPTPKHQEVVRGLGLNPDEFQIRCIAQDEYARDASAKQWGNKNLWTNFDGYFLGGFGRRGLSGGNREHGGASGVSSRWSDGAPALLAVRLVLSRKRV